MKTKNKSWGGFEKFKPTKVSAAIAGTMFDVTLTQARLKLNAGAKLSQREVCALAREASRGNDVGRKEASK